MKLRDWMGRDITTLREDAEELEDEEVEPEDDEDAFDKEFMKDDTDEDPVELTSESVNWSKIFK